MSHTIFKASLQPSNRPSPHTSHSANQSYHLPHSFSPTSKEDPSKPDRQKPLAQTRIKKLSFLLNPNTDNLLRSDDDPAPHINSMVSFHTPSRSSGGEISKKFIQLKGSASSNQLSFDFFNSKDLVRLAMSKAKSKETVKKERVRTPSGISPTAFKKPISQRMNASLVSFDKEDGGHRLLSPTENEGIGSRGARPPAGDKAAKVRRLHQIYNEASPGDRTRQIQTNLHAMSQDFSNQLFHHSLSPSSNSLSRPPAGGYMYKPLGSHSQSTRQKPNQEQSKRQNKLKEDEYSTIKTPSVENSSERFSQLKKVTPTHAIKPNSATTPMGKLTFTAAPPVNNEIKERGRSPNSRVRRIKLPFENNEGFDSVGRKILESRSRKDSYTELESAVHNLVRTCEQSLEPNPKARGAAERVKIAQENVLDRLRGLVEVPYNNGEHFEAVLREKKMAEGELSVVKEENERLRRRMQEMCQRFKANQLKKKAAESDSMIEDAVSVSKREEDSDSERTSNLKMVIEHQHRIILDMRKNEHVVNKVLDIIKKTGVNVEDFASFNNIEEESFQGLSTTDLNKEKMTESPQMEEGVSQWDSKENQEITETDKEEDQREIDDKMISGIRESEDESVRQRIGKHTYSDAKSTADSAGLSTRKLTKGRRSLSIKMKSKLKLDLTRVTGSLSVPKYNIVSGQSSGEKFFLNFPAENGQGFHEEFMSRFEEFSQSWRQAALHQKL